MKTRPRRSVFLLAAELQFDMMELNWSCESVTWDSKNGVSISQYSCDNINEASCLIKGVYGLGEIERSYYAKRFRPVDQKWQIAWWPRLKKDKWDHESRILALLLCAEMLRR